MQQRAGSRGFLLTGYLRKVKTLSHPYHLDTADDVLETLSDMFTRGSQKRDTLAIRAVGRSLSSHPVLSLHPHTSKMAAVECDDEVVVEASISDHTTEKKIAVGYFDQESCSRQDVWLTIFQVKKAGHSLCAISQTHYDNMMEFSRRKTNQYGVRLIVGLITVAILAYG